MILIMTDCKLNRARAQWSKQMTHMHDSCDPHQLPIEEAGNGCLSLRSIESEIIETFRQRHVQSCVITKGSNLVKTSQRMLLVVTIKPIKKVREKIKYSLRAPTLSTRHRKHTCPCCAAKISHDKQFETEKKSITKCEAWPRVYFLQEWPETIEIPARCMLSSKSEDAR